MNQVVEITDQEHFQNVTKDSKLSVVDFSAVWCGPCKRMTPVFAALAEQYNNQANFYSLDIDEVSEVAEELDVSAIPCFKFFVDGNEVDQFLGGNVQGFTEKLLTVVQKYSSTNESVEHQTNSNQDKVEEDEKDQAEENDTKSKETELPKEENK